MKEAQPRGHWRWYLSAVFYRLVELPVAHQVDEDFFAYLGDAVRGAIIADCGCGPGIVVRKFLERGAARIYAVDANPWMLIQVQHLIRDCTDPERVVTVQEAFSPGFFQSFADDASKLAFNIVLFKRSLYVRPEQACTILCAAGQSLVPGGVLAVIHPEHSFMRYAFGPGMRLKSHTAYYMFNRAISRLSVRTGIGEYTLYDELGLLALVRGSLPGFLVESIPTRQNAYNVVVARRPLEDRGENT